MTHQDPPDVLGRGGVAPGLMMMTTSSKQLFLALPFGVFYGILLGVHHQTLARGGGAFLLLSYNSHRNLVVPDVNSFRLHAHTCIVPNCTFYKAAILGVQ